MYLRWGNTAFSIGPYLVPKLWNTGWRVVLYRRMGRLCILRYTRQPVLWRVILTEREGRGALSILVHRYEFGPWPLLWCRLMKWFWESGTYSLEAFIVDAVPYNNPESDAS